MSGYYAPDRSFSIEKGHGNVVIRPVEAGDLPAEASDWAIAQVALVREKGWAIRRDWDGKAD